MTIQKNKRLRFTGGGKLGSMKSIFPCVTLFVTCDKITLHFGMDTYCFLPYQVACLKSDKAGLSILHTVTKYPSEIIFKGNNNSQKIIKKIKDIEFNPCGKADNTKITNDNPFNIYAIILFALLNIGLAIANFVNTSSKSILERRFFIPGRWEISYLLSILLIIVAIQNYSKFQNLIIKSGRSFQEVKHIFSSFQQITTVILATFITQFIRQESLNGTFGISHCIGIIGCLMILLMPIIRASYLGSN